ncbi:hypothetical protein BJX70DRAFT_398680 [Aspergillus crustosus]
MSLSGDHLKELQRDLRGKFERHGDRVAEIWRSWSPCQRAKALRAGVADGVMLKSRTDRSLLGLLLLAPEWNIRELTEPTPETLLMHLRHRALAPLTEQYPQGPNDDAGDVGVIFHSMERGLREKQHYPNQLTVFYGEDTYGCSMITKDAATYNEVMTNLYSNIDAPIAMSRETGELIMPFIQIPNVKAVRAIVLQELSNVCYLGYEKAQDTFKLCVQADSGSKYFRRVAGGRDNKPTVVIMKVKPESLGPGAEQIQCLLTLCTPKVTTIKAIPWMRKLHNLHRLQSSKLQHLTSLEVEAFGDLALTATFI